MAEQIPYEHISQPQLEYGHDLLEEFSKRWEVSKLKAAVIINDVDAIKDAYDWEKLNIFLEDYIHKNKPSEPDNLLRQLSN